MSQDLVTRKDAPVVVSMQKIVKKFGDFVANHEIDLELRQGEIHAILGENGAGKSTLMNVLYGLYKPTSGEIYIKGKRVSLGGPNDAIAAGVGMVHQHFMLVEPFTVTENIILGMEPVKGLRQVDIKKARAELQALSEKYNLAIDPDARICDITVGMQQRVEILKVLYRGADILILDEPTASLTPQEIDELIDIMHNLVKNGKSILLITHKLKEIKAAADRCTIIRRGKWIDTVEVADTTEEELANKMVGRAVCFVVDKKDKKPGDTVLKVEDLVVHDYRGLDAVRGLNLEVRGGEIVGLAGVDGNGQSEFVDALCGIRPVVSGKLTLDGVDITNQSPRERFEAGLSCIPEDRQRDGLVLEYSVAQNLCLQTYKNEPFAKHGILQKDKFDKQAEILIKYFDIRPESCANNPAGSLSGGNQQKVIIAREVTNNKDLLIAFNPTRGLDVGAIEFVHKYLVEQRNKGKAILLVSFELDEIICLSDRIEVIYNGAISGSVDAKTIDETCLGMLMAGGKLDG